MRQSRTLGSVRGAARKGGPYRDCRAGEWVEDSCTHRRRLRFLRGDVAWVVGADPAPAVRRNPAVDESIVLPEGLSLSFPAAQFDIVI